MDKISDLTKGLPISQPGKVESSKSNLFQESLEKAQERNRTEQTRNPKIESLGEVKPTTFPNIGAASTEVVNRTNKLIDLLDHYAKDIDNPRKTLKDLEPLIISIKNNASQLMKEADNTLPGDADLKTIATESAITANVEYIKFYRGDYN